jgi:hypothetical protein
MSEEIIVKVKWNGQPADVVVGEISWEQKTKAIRKSMVEKQVGRQMKKESDPILQKELMMLESIKKAPFEKTLENLNKLSSKDGEKVYEAYSKMNEINSEDEDGNTGES